MSTERDDILDALTKHRGFLRFTVQGLSDDQAAATPTASELCLGGLIKHVAKTERGWADFVLHGAAGEPAIDWDAVDWSAPPPAVLEHVTSFRILEGETLAGLLAAYEEVAAHTDDLVRSVDLDQEHALPAAPWNEPGASWSNRRVFTHIVAETAQHAGHADILRETLDGQKTMG